MVLRYLIPVMLAAFLATAIPLRAAQLLYLASSKDKTIVAYHVDERTGRLTEKFSSLLPGNPGPLAFSPDQSYVYASVNGLEGGKSGVTTLKRAKNGKLSLIKTVPITARSAYIRTDNAGRLLLAAHYGSGEVTVYRITDGVCTGELLDQVETERTAHCVELDSTGRFVFVPHTTPNKVYQFRLNAATGKLTANDPPHASGPDESHAYHQPRHFTLHPKLEIAYTSNERGGGITAWKLDADKGTLEKLQTLSTLPASYEGSSAAADIHVTPDGRFAYVSNRDVTKRGEKEGNQDTLAAFALNAKTGKMKLVGHVPTAYFPRTFCVDVTGQFVYCAGQRGASMFAYRIDQKTGALKYLATYETGGGPIWVMCGNTGG